MYLNPEPVAKTARSTRFRQDRKKRLTLTMRINSLRCSSIFFSSSLVLNDPLCEPKSRCWCNAPNKLLERKSENMAHFGYGPDDISYIGYLIGILIIIVTVILPLSYMGLRARNVFRRNASVSGPAAAGSNGDASQSAWYAS